MKRTERPKNRNYTAGACMSGLILLWIGKSVIVLSSVFHYVLSLAMWAFSDCGKRMPKFLASDILNVAEVVESTPCLCITIYKQTIYWLIDWLNFFFKLCIKFPYFSLLTWNFPWLLFNFPTLGTYPSLNFHINSAHTHQHSQCRR